MFLSCISTVTALPLVVIDGGWLRNHARSARVLADLADRRSGAASVDPFSAGVSSISGMTLVWSAKGTVGDGSQYVDPIL